MIVRINQIDIARIAADDGWPEGSYAASLRAGWPEDARAFELLILSQDERQQPLTDDFRQHQLRQVIPQAAIALTSPSLDAAPIVARLDGTFAADELIDAWRYLTEEDGSGQFAFSPTIRRDAGDEPGGSVRIAPTWRRLAHICADTTIGLERTVRLRLFSVPATSVLSLIEVSATDDDRWPQLLGECSFYLSTTPELKGLHLVVRGLDTVQVKSRVMQRLMAVGRGEPSVP